MKDKTRKTIIPASFLENYGDKAWYGYTSCLVEFQACLNDLRYFICKTDLRSARQVIHQMLGTTGMIEDGILLERLMIVQTYLKEDYGLDQTLQALNELESRLSGQISELVTNRPARSLLMFGSQTFSDQVISELLELPCLDGLETLFDIDKLEEEVEYQLPDILLIIKDSIDKHELKIIGKIRKRYLGTKILYFDRSTNSIPKLKRFVRRRCKTI